MTSKHYLAVQVKLLLLTAKYIIFEEKCKPQRTSLTVQFMRKFNISLARAMRFLAVNIFMTVFIRQKVAGH